MSGESVRYRFNLTGHLRGLLEVCHTFDEDPLQRIACKPLARFSHVGSFNGTVPKELHVGIRSPIPKHATESILLLLQGVSSPEYAGVVTGAPAAERFDTVQTTWKEWWAGTGLNRRHQDFQAWCRDLGSARKLLPP